MSELVTLTTGLTATIYGTFAAAGAYIGTMLGDAYTAFLALTPDDQKRALNAAGKYIDRQAWISTANTFALRDAIAVFPQASYELAAMAAEDSSVLAAADNGTNIKAVGAGGAFVDYFNPTSVRFGSATKLPQIVQDLLGDYLATSDAAVALGGTGSTGGTMDPFSSCSMDSRNRPF